MNSYIRRRTGERGNAMLTEYYGIVRFKVSGTILLTFDLSPSMVDYISARLPTGHWQLHGQAYQFWRHKSCSCGTAPMERSNGLSATAMNISDNI